MQEHMRIGLLDPRWLEQRDRSIRDRQTEDEVYAPGLDIESSLKQLAERRTDIFGVEETAIGKKIGEEEIQKPEEKVSEDMAFTSEFGVEGNSEVNDRELAAEIPISTSSEPFTSPGYLGRPLRKHGSYPAGSTGQHHPAGTDRSHSQGQRPGGRGRHEGENWPKQAE